MENIEVKVESGVKTLEIREGMPFLFTNPSRSESTV